MKRPSFRVPPLFPPYTPDPGHAPELAATLESYGKQSERWGKRLLVYTGVMAMAITAGGYLGFRGPDTQKRLTVVEDSVKKFSKDLDSSTRLLQENIRISCAVLRSLQPAAIVQPESCAPSALMPPPPFVPRR